MRNLLKDRNIRPELLPAAEDTKKLERQLKAEQKKLPAAVKPLDEPPTPTSVPDQP